VWRGIVDDDATSQTLAEHERIYAALCARDEALSSAAALMHVATTQTWLRRFLEQEGAPDASLA
jgi:DNA-binding FadR family transcriptional regulator